MIFAFKGHIGQIVCGRKTQTRRNSKKYSVGRTYAIQPKRGVKGDPRGRILITKKWPECRGQKISIKDADEEGGYTPEAYEKLYFKMNMMWSIRWCYEFEFWSIADFDSLWDALARARREPSVPWSTIKSQQLRNKSQSIPSALCSNVGHDTDHGPIGAKKDLKGTRGESPCSNGTILSKELRTLKK